MTPRRLTPGTIQQVRLNLFTKRSKNKPQFYAGIARWCELKGMPGRDLGKSVYLVLSPLPYLSNGDNSHFSALLKVSLSLLNKTWIAKSCEQCKLQMGRTQSKCPAQPLTCHDSYPFFLIVKKRKEKAFSFQVIQR